MWGGEEKRDAGDETEDRGARKKTAESPGRTQHRPQYPITENQLVILSRSQCRAW